MNDSLEQRRFDILSGHPPSPTAAKQRRSNIQHPSTPPAASLDSQDLSSAPFRFQSLGTNPRLTPDLSRVAGCQTSPLTSCSTGSTDGADALKRQSQVLDQQTHATRLALQEQMTAGKGTEAAYARHVKNYIEFWDAHQASRLQDNPMWVVMPAHPITATKVAVFLESESTRCKVCG
jgi:hypothetical protein